MFSRRFHLIGLAMIYLGIPVLLIIYRVVAYGVPYTDFSGFLRFYQVVAVMLAPPFLLINIVSLELLYLGLEKTDKQHFDDLRTVFRYAVWKEVHEKFPPKMDSEKTYTKPSMRTWKSEK